MSTESHVHVHVHVYMYMYMYMHARVGCLQVNILENFATDLETKYFYFNYHCITILRISLLTLKQNIIFSFIYHCITILLKLTTANISVTVNTQAPLNSNRENT